MYDTNAMSSGRSKTALLFLALSAVTVGYVVIFAGGPIAQSHGDLRLPGLIGILLAGVLGTLHCLFVKPAPRFHSLVERLVLLVPAYALFQVLPLPLGVIRIVSPARARLVDGLEWG